MAATVKLSPDLSLGNVSKLFDWEKPPALRAGRLYDMSPLDGRFLMTKPVARVPESNSTPVWVVLNWLEELRQIPRR
jgi:hypothetical protein